MKKTMNSPYLNILRIIAAFLVYMHHVRIFTDNTFMTKAHFLIRTCAWAGVWMFFILGGVLAGKGFAEGRYQCNSQSILKYWRRKLRNVYLPTIGFIFLVSLFAFPDFIPQYPSVLLSFLTCTYRGSPGVDGIGATWYVFVTMWFYLLTPFAAMVFQRLHKRGLFFVLIIAILAGYIFRTIGYHSGWSWNQIIYYPVYANADLFFSGMVLSFIVQKTREEIDDTKKRIKVRGIRVTSSIILCSTILINSWFMNEWELGTDFRYLVQHVFPTIYIISVLFFVYSFELGSASSKTKFADFVAVVSGYTFEFYLFHSIVLNRIQDYFRFESLELSFVGITVACFIISGVLAVGFKRVFKMYGQERTRR